MPYGTVNADVIGTSVANSNIGAGNATRFKNRIINGDMRIDQRNAGASLTPTTTTTQYSLDRWAMRLTQASKYSVQQSTVVPTGFLNSMVMTSLSAYSVTSTDFFGFEQRLECGNVYDLAWGTANAKTITLSFWVRSSLTGTFGGVIYEYNNGYPSYPFSYTISAANTWQQISLTIPGPTSGTFTSTANNGSFIVSWSLGAGSATLGTANTWNYSTLYRGATGQTNIVSTNGATLYVTGAQLEVGSSATGFEYVDYGTQFAMCQRYFANIPANYEAIAYYSDRLTNGMMFLPVVMRTSPTVTGGSWTAHTGNAGTYAVANITPNYFRQYNSANNWTGGAICTVVSAVLASAEL